MALQARAETEIPLPKSPQSGTAGDGLRFDRSVIDCLALPACLCAKPADAASWRVLAWNALAAADLGAAVARELNGNSTPFLGSYSLRSAQTSCVESIAEIQ
jgi:hypothetical protein